MLTEVKAGPYTVRGVSVGGIYTTLQIPELRVLLDVGLHLRSVAATDDIFLSHGHADHAAGLMPLLGIRAVLRRHPATVYAPAEIVPALERSVGAACALHQCAFELKTVPLCPGDQVHLRDDLYVRALRTHHSVPSLGYVFLRQVQKLRDEHAARSGEEIAALRASGTEDLFDVRYRPELAYVTDSLASVLETSPEVLESRVLLLECSFIGGERTEEDAHARTHVHLDEIIARADRFRNEALVLMHFSQVHSPEEVREVMAERLPAELRERVVLFAPNEGPWFG